MSETILQGLHTLVERYLDDILIVAGCGLILRGTYLVNPTATWFVGGAMLILLGVATGLQPKAVR